MIELHAHPSDCLRFRLRERRGVAQAARHQKNPQAFDSIPIFEPQVETAYLLTVGTYKKVSGSPFPSVSLVAF